MPISLTENAISAVNQQGRPRKGNPQRLHVEYPKRGEVSNDEATLLGILYTDGCLSKKSENCWRFYLSNTSSEIINTFRKCMINVFGLENKRIRISEKIINGKPFYKAIVDSGYCGNILNSKYGTFRTLAYKTVKDGVIYPATKIPFNNTTSKNLLSVFLKAAFSCDGGVNLYVANHRNGYKHLIRSVFLACKHPQLQKDYLRLLKILGIRARLLLKDNKLRIEKREDLQKFYEKVGFIKGVKITQHSAYWQGWEKNQVLSLALSSYGNNAKIYNLPQFLG